MVAPLLENKKDFLIKQQRKRLKNTQRSINSDRESSSSDGETMQHFDSGPIIENAESENEERNKRPGSQRTKHSSGFMVAFKNAKTQQSKLHLVDMGKHDAYHKWFEISSAAGRAKSYKINLCQCIC